MPQYRGFFLNIAAHLDQKITTDALAKIAGLSAFCCAAPLVLALTSLVAYGLHSLTH
jgi:hypothetical protein